MKRAILFFVMLLTGVLTFAEETITVSANSEDISQSLDLRVVAKLFAEASTTEQFENMLNNPDSAFSNLDLNGDNQIDYLRVVEGGTADNKLIVIQAVLAKNIYQDVASIYVEKDTKTQEVSVQIIGDEYIYGTNYIIEPVYVYHPIIYNWFWSACWYCWKSPWYWGNWPSWWYYRQCYTYHWYYDRCYRFHQYHHHYCSFRHGCHPHHHYHAVYNSVSRRDYAVSHPNNSFNRRHTDVRNAGEFHRTGIRQRNGGIRQPNFSNTSRTFDSRNTTVQRSGSSQRTQTSQSQRTISASVSTQHSTSQSGASRSSQARSSNNSNRSIVSTQQETNNWQIRSSSSSSYRSSGNYSSSPSRSFSSSSTSRSSGSYSGGSNRSSRSSVSRSSGSGGSSRRR